MRLEFILEKDGKNINTYNGIEIDTESELLIRRFERKHSVALMRRKIRNNLFYKYDVKTEDDKVVLSVYEGFFKDIMNWHCIYTVVATFGVKGILETGDGDLEYWHEFFATDYGYTIYNEANVKKFSFDDDSMENVRKVFPFNMQTNAFLFFEKYSKLKKIKIKKIDKKIFNIPAVKINRNVGKAFNGQFINYAIQREIELAGEVFFDITVLSGVVENGIIDVEEKHRYFITEDFAYSPDGGSLSVFVSDNIYGNVYDKNMSKRYPNLMLDKYKGRYYYQYFFAKEFIPCFEILAKAGFSELADMFLRDYYKENKDWSNLNIYGKNDKAIFGFKLNKLRNIDSSVYYGGDGYDGRSFNYCDDFKTFINRVKRIASKSPYLLDAKDIDSDLFYFMERRIDVGITIKDIDYVKSIGTGNAAIYADYLGMCKETGKACDGTYPSNIKNAHDVMVTYINQLKEAKKNKQFEEVVSMEDYLSCLYDGDKYCVLAPRNANDLVNESYQLSHCVRTYIKDVALGYTKIYFLRLKEKKAKSLVTLEVKRGEIRQARGKGNRRMSNEEDSFVKEWARNKNLIPAYDYYW